MIRSLLFITICTFISTAQAYEQCFTLTASTKRGGKSPKQVINTIKQDKAVVFFTKPGCPFCVKLRPHFNTLAHQNSNKAQFIVMNVGGDTSYKSAYGFSTYPTVAYFKDGKKVAQHGSNNGKMNTKNMHNYLNKIA